MKKLLFICLLTSFCCLWAEEQKSDSTETKVLEFSPTLTIGRGIYENDNRYSGAVTTADSVNHALAGSDIKYSVKIDTKGGELLSGVFDFGDNKESAEIEGDSLLNVTYRSTSRIGQYDNINLSALVRYHSTEIVERDSIIVIADTLKASVSGLSGDLIAYRDSIIQIQDTVAVQRDTTVVYQMPKDMTFALYGIPSLPIFSYETTKVNELDSCSINYSGSATGGTSNWDYIWSKNKERIGTNPTLNEILKHSIEGDSMKTEVVSISLCCKNIAPDNSTVWFKDSINVADFKFYNSPKPAKSIDCIRNGNNSIYIASGFEVDDEDLEKKGYIFIFNDSYQQTVRYLVNPSFAVKDVKTLWKYDDFDCYSEKTNFDESQIAEPFINVGLSVEKGIYKDDLRFKGHVTTTDGVTHILAGSDISYFIAIDPKGGELVSGTITYGNKEVEAEVSGNFLLNQFPYNNDPGNYENISVKAVLRFMFDKKQPFYFNTEFEVPKNKTFVIYPKPTLPEPSGDYIKQIAYNSEMPGKENVVEVNMSVIPGEGGTAKWEYTWSTENEGKQGSTTELDYLTLNSSVVSGYYMKTASDNVQLEYRNIAPDGSVWISDSFTYPVMIYNAPSRPISLTEKGPANTSNIYIVSMDILKFGTSNLDNILKERGYVFIYGNDDEVVSEKSATTDTKDCRWCNYTGHGHNNPWVETVWRYAAKDGFPAFECKSLRRYASDSRGEDPGTTGIDAIISDGTSAKIYTIEGKLMSTTDIKSLPTGVYIIEKDLDGQISRAKIVVK